LSIKFYCDFDLLNFTCLLASLAEVSVDERLQFHVGRVVKICAFSTACIVLVL